MQFVLLLLVLLIAGVFLYPPWAEGTDTACAAFGHRARALADAQARRDAGGNPRRQQFLSLVQGTIPAGLLAEAYVRARFPELPPGIACTVAYWKIWQNPDPTATVAALKR